MFYLEKFEKLYPNYIGYFYALIATFFVSTHSVLSKSLKKYSNTEIIIYRFIIIFIISWINARNGKGKEGYERKASKIEYLLVIRSLLGH